MREDKNKTLKIVKSIELNNLHRGKGSSDVKILVINFRSLKIMIMSY